MQQIVILLHGIRTTGGWAEMVAHALAELGHIKPVTIRYGYLDVLRFLFPWWTRKAPIERVKQQIRAIRDQNPSASISVIAHSFGTYVIAKILETESDIRFHHVVLCGAIVRSDFRWELVRPRVGGVILNDCGTRDIWPVLAQGLTWGYGASGTHGMAGACVEDRFFPYRHSDFFNRNFVEKFWLPLFRNDTVVRPRWQETRPVPPWWMHVLGFPVLRWLLMAIILSPLPLLALQAGSDCGRFEIAWISTDRSAENHIEQLMQSERTVDRALVEAREYVRRYPHAWTGHTLLGTLRFRAGDIDDALSEFQLASRACPNNSSLKANVASALLAKGRADEAETLLSKLLATEPATSMRLANYAEAELLLEKYSNAKTHFAALYNNEGPYRGRAALGLGLATLLANPGNKASVTTSFDYLRKAVCLDESNKALVLGITPPDHRTHLDNYRGLLERAATVANDEYNDLLQYARSDVRCAKF